MLELRPVCENCKRDLPPNSTEALICTYECTFCTSCNDEFLHNVCPNCGGGFTPRPIRPKSQLERNPPTSKVLHKPIEMTSFLMKRDQLKNIPPEKR